MFDPFGDFETKGYLRNVLALKDREEMAELEHHFFVSNLSAATCLLSGTQSLTYLDYCEVHRILFNGLYPWAGRDRQSLGIVASISKGARVRFERAESVRLAVEHGLRLGSDRQAIARNPGQVLGQFAWAHPFLEGNGRTMIVVHSELLHRAGFAIDWASIDRDVFLEALAEELENPQAGFLDRHLLPLLSRTDASRPWLGEILTQHAASAVTTEASSPAPALSKFR